MIKKAVALLFLILVVLSFYGCADKGTDNSNANNISSVSNAESIVSVSSVSSEPTESISSKTESSSSSIPEFTESQDYSWTNHQGVSTFIKSETHYFNYHGRWQEVSGGKKAHWIRPYFEFNFKGESFKIVGTNINKISVYVDGVKQGNNVNGDYTVSSGEHLIRVTALDSAEPFVFNGIQTEGDISRAKSRERYFLFIGDSLTHSAESYSVVIPELLDADYTCIAMSGIALRDGKGYYNLPTGQTQKLGMESAFFNYQAVNEVGRYDEYSFSNERQPESIIIQIGTNDALSSESEKSSFVTKSTNFIKRLRQIYPAAKIIVALPKADHASGWRHKIIEAAAMDAIDKVDNVTFIDTRDWDVEISNDGIHPTADGYKAYANYLIQALNLY